MFKREFKLFFKKAFDINCKKCFRTMNSVPFEGEIAIKEEQLNLDLTLLGGQSFRWQKTVQSSEKSTQWSGVAFDAYWQLTQTPKAVKYKVFPVPSATPASTLWHSHEVFFYKQRLERYFRLDFDLPANVAEWRAAHEHFARVASQMKAVRVLHQEPLENIISFICSQNNNIKRISTMIQWLCSKYGRKIGNFQGRDEFTFPSLDTLVRHRKELEKNLREAKFGYRAKFIAQTVAKIADSGGEAWFANLRALPYGKARLELVTLPGIGFKVADCICLMSLDHLEAVPIDTHIYKIAQTAYLPHLAKVKSVTPKTYEDIAGHFRTVYGPYAGWAQAVLFCSELQQFQAKPDEDTAISKSKPKKKRN